MFPDRLKRSGRTEAVWGKVFMFAGFRVFRRTEPMKCKNARIVKCTALSPG